MIKQMTKLGENFFPKTTTAAVVDETSGKTLEAMLPYELDMSVLGSEPITEELFDSLWNAAESGRPIIIVGTGQSAMPAVAMKNSDGDAIILSMLVSTELPVAAVTYSIVAGVVPEPLKLWHMVTAGQGVEITYDGTINCTLDTNPFIIPSDGNLPETGEEGKIYLIPATSTGDQNVMLEYVWVNGVWEKFGEFKTEVDLSQYAKKEYVNDAINSAIVNVLNTEV